MSNKLPDFSGARVLVVGDVMLDRYWHGPTSRISPEAPVPVVRVRDHEARPGGAANAALNAAALGVRTTLLGVVGRDEAARLLSEQLLASGIDAQFVETADCPTITKLRVISRNQQLIRLDFEEALSAVGAFDADALQARFEAALPQADVVLLSDYGKGSLIGAAAMVAAARAVGKPVIIDPKGNDWTDYRGASLLTPNLGEFEAVAGVTAGEEDLFGKAQTLCTALDLAALLVTRSEHGMSLIQPDTAPLTLPTEAREVFDVTGAGDTVIAVLAASVAAGESWSRAAYLANVAAGIVVGKLGTATASREELAAALAGKNQNEDGAVVTRAELLARIAAARKQGERVVMTNGCFDLLHVGHLRYLEAARALGDRLVVAVNDDDSVRRLKGPTRPLNACDDRMRMLAGLKCVDWVLPFSEDTPADLIAAVLPDILVKGGDYRIEQIAGHEAVIAHGGEVRVLDFHAGYSTSSLIERARKP